MLTESEQRLLAELAGLKAEMERRLYAFDPLQA